MDSKIVAVGVPWYHPEEFHSVVSLFSDAHKLSSTYQDWLKLAEKTVQQIQASGKIAEKVYLDTVIFPAWCKDRGMDIDAKGRLAFANWMVFRKYGGHN